MRRTRYVDHKARVNGPQFNEGELVLLNHGYGAEELIQFKYYMPNGRWARGVSLTWPGVWQQFDTMRCRRPNIS